MSTTSKYWEKYKEKKTLETHEKSDLSKMMTDKQAYITYLEVQLEKVTQSVLLTQTFTERLENLQFQFQTSDEKLSQLTKLVKLQQTYSEKQEEDLSTFKNSLDLLVESKTSHLAASLQSAERRVKVLEDKIDLPRGKNEQNEDFSLKLASALKTQDSKLEAFLIKTNEDLELKVKKINRTLESNLDLKINNLSESFLEISKKIQKFQDFQIPEDRIQKTKEKNEFFLDKIEKIENSVKDLENFLMAVAEDVKKLENNQQVFAESESRITKNFNARLQKLSETIQKNGNIKENQFSPEKFLTTKDFEFKDSPKFPTLESENKKKSRESSFRKKSKSKSKDSIDAEKTPKSSDSSIKTPKTNRSLSPAGGKKESFAVAQKNTPKSKIMEACIKDKVKKMKNSSGCEKESLKFEEKSKSKKKHEKKSKLDKLYQELFTKS